VSDPKNQESTDATAPMVTVALTEMELAELTELCGKIDDWRKTIEGSVSIDVPRHELAKVKLAVLATVLGSAVPRLLAEVRRLRALLAPKPAPSQCPRGCAGSRLVALVSADGTAWEAEGCLVCGGCWVSSPPLPATEIPAGLERWTTDGFARAREACR